jgi:hypothetical protein
MHTNPNQTKIVLKRTISYVGWVLLLLTIAYPLLVYFTFTSARASSTDLVQASPLKVPVPATLQKTANSVTSTGQLEENSSNPEQLFREVQAQNKELARYSALIDYLKIFLPTFSAMFLAVLGTLGYYFVQTQVANSIAATTKDLTEKANNAIAAMTEAKEKLAAFEKTAEELIDLRMEHSLVSIYHSLSIVSWHSGSYDDAIFYGNKNLKRLENLIPRMQQKVEKISAHEDHAFKHEHVAKLKKLKEYQVLANGDLAYYYADRFAQTGDGADRNYAIEFARTIPTSLSSITSVGAKSKKLHLVDNYLYAMAIDSTGLESTDHRFFVEIFENYKGPLNMLLSNEVGRKKLKKYEEAFDIHKKKIQ